MRRPLFTWAILSIAAIAPAVALASDAQDKAAAEQIATIVRDSGQLKNYSLGVKYRNGTAWLSGRVTSEEQMQQAIDLLSNIEGVEQIVNNMSVSGGGAGLQQPLGVKPSARRTSYTSGAQMDVDSGGSAASQQPMQGDPNVVPAGYRMLGRRRKYMRPMAMYGGQAGAPPAAYDSPHMPRHAWPSYASYPNYAALTYPKQYSATAFPYIGPFYPYPQVPLGWRKVSLEWDDGWWFLDFKDRGPY